MMRDVTLLRCGIVDLCNALSQEEVERQAKCIQGLGLVIGFWAEEYAREKRKPMGREHLATMKSRAG